MATTIPSHQASSAGALLEVIRELIASKLGLPAEAVAPGERFRRLGVDSLTATAVVAELGSKLGRTLSPTLAWQYPTPLHLAAFLAGSPPAGHALPEVLSRADGEPVAVIGMACRFPGAPDPAAYWELLRRGIDAVKEVPRDRWDVTALFDADAGAPGKVATRWGGFLDDVAGFDASFFGISPREAAEIDPQQRLMLELAWEALEDAGVPPTSLKDTRAGVFFGAMWGDYGRLPGATVDRVVQHTATGRDLSIVPARVSYSLGLLGPSLAVNTACSSSLVAVHLARQSLQRGESRVALAGGVNLMLSPESTVVMSKFGAMAPDGRSKAFDARANGYVRGEGGGVVLLKRLSDAMADGDRVYCVIRGSAINNDGFSNGLTAPSPRAQEAVIRDACADAGVAAGEVQYVETHGTGTMLGDPIEAGALGAALGKGRTSEARLAIGSVKTNIGHLEAAAGVAGLIKVALAMHHRELPPSLHFEKPNPHIAFDDLGIRVQASLGPWEAAAGRRIAGVSSFGFGGTNAHVVLEASEEPEVVLLFGGQGSQWRGMGRALLRSSARARETLERCDQAMRRLVPWSLVERLEGGDAALFDQTDFVQPALFAMQVTLAGELRARGFRIGAVVGQSLGEVAAAHVAGALTLDDAARVICVRSELVSRVRGGRMAVVGLSFDGAAEAIDPWKDRVSIAVAAGQQSTVVAGDDEAIAAMQAALEARGVVVRPIRVDYASHSRFMDPLLAELASRLDSIAPRTTDIAFWSTVTGDRVGGQDLGAAYWVRNLRQPVLFAQTVGKLASARRAFVEVDPHPVLAQFVEPILAGAGRPSAVVACALRDEPETSTLAAAEKDLVRAGCSRSGARVEGPSALVCVSARTPAALDAAADRLRALVEGSDLSLEDVAYASIAGRSALEHRLVIPTRSREALLEALRVAARSETPAGAARSEVREPIGGLAWLFTGQGAQVSGMGQGLASEWPAFRAAFEAAAQEIDPHLDVPLREVVWAAPGTPRARDLDRTAYTQPALFAFEWALAALWRSWGIEPDFVAGHSVGEITAACVAGVFSLSEAARLVCARARLMDSLPAGGAMVAIEAPEEEVAAAVAPFAATVSIAAVNGPRSVVVAGEEGHVLAIAEAAARGGAPTRRLAVSHAFHSPLVETMLADFRRLAETIAFAAPSRPMVSSTTGKLAAADVANAEFWVSHARRAVRFGDAVRTLDAAGVRRFLEVGPKATLLALVPASAPGARLLLPSLRAGSPEAEAVIEALAELHAAGHALSAEHLFRRAGPRASLPMYPWQRERYWLEACDADALPAGAHPLLGRAIRISTDDAMRVWEIPLSLRSHPWLADHVVAGSVVFPAAAYAEIGLAVAAELGNTRGVVTDIEVVEVLALPGKGSVLVQIVARPERSGAWSVQVSSRGGEAWTVHARAAVRSGPEGTPAPFVDLAPWRTSLGSGEEPGPFYGAMARAGLAYGPCFRGVAAFRGTGSTALGRVALPVVAGSGAAYTLHPALLDACLQVMEGVLLGGQPASWLPVGIGSVEVYARPAGALWCKFTEGPAAGDRERTGDLVVAAEDGAVIAEVRGIAMRRSAAADARRPEDDWMLAPTWEASSAPASCSAGGRWLMVSRATALATDLRASLEADGGVVVVVDGAGPPDRLRRTLGDAFGGAPPTGVIHLGTVDRGQTDLEAELASGCDEVLALVRAISAAAWRDPPRLTIVTRGVQSVDGGDVRVLGSPLVGLARVVAMEHPALGCVRVDLDPAPSSADAAHLLAELCSDGSEQEVAWRRGTRRVLRLARASAGSAPGPRPTTVAKGRSFALRIGRPGMLDRLELRETTRTAPPPGHVEIEVEASGMNFRDVLLALGVVPGGGPRSAIELGMEASGRVVAVGEGVPDRIAGEAVIALAPHGAIGSHLTTRAELVVPRPPGWSPADAAGALIAPLTAWYALEKVARLRRGERVLVHAAAGGVGLAAVEWAQHVGAEVFATAGSESKRAYLRERGVRFVSDSRSDAFVTDVLGWTDGDGVDVVLNSLSGDLIDKSLGLLRSHGRFVELGKRDYYANRTLGLRPFLRSLTLSLVDIHGMVSDRPAWVGELLAELMAEMKSGALTPPSVRALPVSRAEEAFRTMAQGHHIGKLALTLEDPDARVTLAGAGTPSIRRDATYLVTGGLGALGLIVAEWLARSGAGHLVLVGRRAEQTHAQREALGRIRSLGPSVRVVAADVTDRTALAGVLANVPAERPLRGVFHLAGVLDDATIADQTPARLRSVMAAKAAGALNLHELLSGTELDLFVLYSSATGLLGSPGQANYAAANTLLDALAHHRRASGLPAISIDWGVFGGLGLAAQTAGGQRLEGRGMRSLSAAEGIAALERVLAQNPVQIGVCPFDVHQWVEFFPSAAASRFLSPLTAASSETRPPTGDREVIERLAAADPRARPAVLEEVLRAQVAQVLRIPGDKIERDVPLAKLGMDSLMGLELRNRVDALLGTRLPAGILWTFPTLAALAGHLAADGAPDAGAAKLTAIQASPTPTDALAREVADMAQGDLMSFVDGLLQRASGSPGK